MKLLSLPASSASIERIFSNFGMLQTKLRNRLGLAKTPNLFRATVHFVAAQRLIGSVDRTSRSLMRLTQEH